MFDSIRETESHQDALSVREVPITGGPAQEQVAREGLEPP